MCCEDILAAVDRAPADVVLELGSGSETTADGVEVLLIKWEM